MPAPQRGRRIRLTCVLAALAFALAAFGGTLRSEDALPVGARFEALRTSMALIGHEVDAGGRPGVTWLGTGFMVDRKCTLASAKHIFHGVNADRFVVRLQSADRERAPILRARVLYRKPELDLVFLQLVGAAMGQGQCPAELRDHLELAEAFDDGLVGEPILLPGFPLIEGEPPGFPVLRRGYVSSAELEWDGSPMLLLDLRSAPGFSGSPVILERTGQVVGVLFGSGLTPREYDLTWATPITRGDLRSALRAAEKHK
jgi:hypothetical protein